MNIEFDSQPIYGDNDKYIKIKTKSYGDKVKTNFQGKKVPMENVSYKLLSLIMLASVIKISKKYYTQTLLEKSKYEIKNDKMENPINDDLGPCWSGECDNESDNKSDNESDCDESND